jgi:hypothetical protein
MRLYLNDERPMPEGWSRAWTARMDAAMKRAERFWSQQ